MMPKRRLPSGRRRLRSACREAVVSYKIATLPDGPPGEFLTDREAAEACGFMS